MSILRINIDEAGYGKKIVLQNISFSVDKGKVVAIIGPNGAGKSTLLKAIVGLTPHYKGEIIFRDASLPVQPHEVIRRGISFVPQGNNIFEELTVRENLEVGGYTISDTAKVASRIDQIIELFPDVAEYLDQNSAKLSGGQKQMLAMLRALMLQPGVLLLDEPSLGLAPKLVSDMFSAIRKINKELNTTVLIVEQKVNDVLKIADLVCALRLGQIAFIGTPEELRDRDVLKKIFLL